MRETETGWPLHLSSGALKRSLRLATVALSLGLAMSVTVAHAADDDDDNLSFEQKAIKSLMTGLGGTNMENSGIDYRERSPLVVPPRLDLPTPAAASNTANVANWPKDPDVQRRREAAAAAKTGRPEEVLEASRTLTPSEMAPKRGRVSSSNVDHSHPGDPNKNIVLSPSQLGVSSGMFKNMFGGNKGETAEFKGEPTRDSLTQPPAGYQTPSGAYAYGTGPKDVMRNEYFINPMTGKY
ncbi:hypothetical protein E0H22_06615 [Rhodopseudomonas boonkerdii]|uniref:hypothetical protein n=1 Tax=Rhodopseudomonas boonkerdii TaxID=475937 RepID=UPI001E4B4BE6|nr:hypothetical protein [Rhodopseudomonas boonkerdii]UGV25380.1 hypothetical protein E0H22_06615 [Rhodopseudomonas boonkerdii]